MKFLLPFLGLLISLFPSTTFAQLIAGEVPSGYNLFESDLQLEIETNDESAINFLDLNQDGENDLKFFIRKEPIELDGTNSTSLSPEHDRVRICRIPGMMISQRAETYEAGTLLECSEPADFEFNSAFVAYSLGRYNSLFAEEVPSQISNEYLHYKWETDTELYEGWIKVSFDLTVENIISLTVHEWVVSDAITSTQTLAVQNKIDLFPNPVQEGTLHIRGAQEIDSFEIYNLQGQLMQSGLIEENEIQVGALNGMVLVKLQKEQNIFSQLIFIQ